ncbi:hypothetical protein EYZ11_005885 [Aspergillus tanneri]|uniref:Flavoprotein oxygenase n=1 Tax=Aspergillus tanneri TaxID=1220188 RepID=A0A4S3JHA2_9EURO|nr:uncharacterized protein ATNIH1004_000425 [Aspergillus tanneri]KAA8651535.1 hypothetical protein ATNIH1004_000425 [Aspergillus tanneri]THC94630.1 hypothetical protein EYZ11_005885 [Aspergillus tanneri]
MEETFHVSKLTDVVDSTYSPTKEIYPHPDGETEHLVHVLNCGYNSSESSTQPSSNDILGVDLDDNDNGDRPQGLNSHSRASSRSSVSSLPMSVLTNQMDTIKPAIAHEAHEHMFWDDQYTRVRGQGQMKHIHTIRQREAAFRKPSSVRAMQMHTEDEGDDDYLTPPRRRGGPRTSDTSVRSSGSSPLKTYPYYSPMVSTGKPKVKKEYPLVLLHCTLLPPSLPVPGLMGLPDPKILKEVLPLEYWRRWKRLEEKVGSGMLRDRGVLISHPEDMYDLLEERLLESLELQRPRLDHGHFVGHDETDSEREDQASREESETDGEQGEECPDCGGRILRPNNLSRKWEIRVFAANGLMRAGAWAAAWKEMEKVDVEVGLWLPPEIRRELEKRLLDNEKPSSRNQTGMIQLFEPINETESQPRSLHQQTPPLSNDVQIPCASKRSSSPVQQNGPFYRHKPEMEIAIQTLLVNYVRVLASDRRNVAIAFLSILVAFFAIGSGHNSPASDLRPFPQDMLHPSPPSSISPIPSSSVDWMTPAISEVPILNSSPISIETVSSSASVMDPTTSATSLDAQETPLTMSEPRTPEPPQIASLSEEKENAHASDSAVFPPAEHSIETTEPIASETMELEPTPENENDDNIEELPVQNDDEMDEQLID